MQKELQEEVEKNQRKFKAQSDDVVHKKPFIPEKSNKPLTDISGFTLNTEKRSEERAEFDMYLKKKEDEVTAQKKEVRKYQYLILKCFKTFCKMIIHHPVQLVISEFTQNQSHQ